MTDAQWQNQVATDLNYTEDAVFNASLANWWSLYSSRGQEQAYWYTRLHAALYLMAKYRESIDVKIGGDTWKASQMFSQAKEIADSSKDFIKENFRGRSKLKVVGVKRSEPDLVQLLNNNLDSNSLADYFTENC